MTVPLADLLEACRAALVRADFAAIAPLTAQIEAAAARPGTSAADLTLIRALALRNAAALEAARAGLRAAQRRMAELRAARAGHSIYDGRGARLRLEPLRGRLRQRL